MAQAATDDHVLNYVTANRFYIEIESELTAAFSECSGLGVKVKKETLFEGGLNDQQRIILGQAEFSDVTLKRGLTNNLLFWDWISKTINLTVNGSQKSNAVRRRNINILLFNQAGEIMQCWTLIGAVSVGWKAPALQATSNTVAIEELTLAYEGLQVVRSAGGGASYLKDQRDQTGSFSSY